MKKQRSNLWLWVLLAVLIVIIIALIIGVIVAKNNGQNGLGGLFGGSGTSSGSGSSSATSEIELGEEGFVGGSDSMSDEETAQTLISERYQANNDVDEATSLYQQAINEATDENKQLAAVLLMVDQMEFMAYNGQCNEAIEYVNSLNVDNLSNNQKKRIYGGGIEVGIYCDDEEEAQKWSDAMNGIGN